MYMMMLMNDATATKCSNFSHFHAIEFYLSVEKVRKNTC